MGAEQALSMGAKGKQEASREAERANEGRPTPPSEGPTAGSRGRGGGPQGLACVSGQEGAGGCTWTF